MSACRRSGAHTENLWYSEMRNSPFYLSFVSTNYSHTAARISPHSIFHVFHSVHSLDKHVARANEHTTCCAFPLKIKIHFFPQLGLFSVSARSRRKWFRKTIYIHPCYSLHCKLKRYDSAPSRKKLAGRTALSRSLSSVPWLFICRSFIKLNALPSI